MIFTLCKLLSTEERTLAFRLFFYSLTTPLEALGLFKFEIGYELLGELFWGGEAPIIIRLAF
jgi:hypothetical protein